MKIYVNLAFLENLFLAEEQTDRHFYMKRLLNSNQPGVEVITDVDIEEAYKDPDKRTILRQIAQRLPLTEVNFIADCQIESFHHSGEPKLVFADGVSLAIDQQFGCFHASTENLAATDWMFYAEPFRISRNQQNWAVLERIKHPCNALVLTDNYLFSNDLTHENLTSILFALMPEKLTGGISFQVTLIGYSSQDNKAIQKQADEVRVILASRFSYPIKLTIIRADHHGRYIHTNYFRIFSEKGFGLFKRNRVSADNETSLDCQPVTLSGRFATVLDTRKEELSKCVAINRTERMADKFDGERYNRLLQ